MDWNQVRQTPQQNGWSSIRNFISSAGTALGTPIVKSLANIGALGATKWGDVQMAWNNPEGAEKSYNRALAARQYAGTEGSFDQGFKSGAGTLVKGGLSALQTALTASGLKYVTPTKLLTTGGLGGVISKVAGGDFATGAGQALGSLPQILGFVGASNPILAKYLPKNTRLNDRVVGAVGNAAQGVAMDLARGTPTTLGSVGLDLASGAVTGTAGFNGLDIPNAKGISPDVWTSDRNTLNEALQRLKVGETIDEFSETGKAIKNMYKEYGLASYPNWNKLSQSQQVNLLSERLDEMARSGFNIKMGITDQPIKTGTKIYHGTTPEIAKMIEDKGFDVKQSYTNSAWFTDNKNLIEKGEVGARGKGAIVERLIDEKKLKLAGWDEYDKYTMDELLAKGYDGVKLPDKNQVTYNIFNPEKLDKQIKQDFQLPEGVMGFAGQTKSPLSPESVSPIKTGGDELVNEARKYKSADEFVENLPKSKGKDVLGRDIPDWRNQIVYHSTDAKSASDISKNGWRILGNNTQMGYYGNAISATPQLEYTKQFGDKLTINKVDPTAKILNLNDEKDWATFQKITKDVSVDQFRQKITEAGFDGVYDVGAGDLFIYNPNKLKNISVVDNKTFNPADIWNKSNLSPESKSTKYKTTVNIQDKNDLNYLRQILGDDRVKDIQAGKMTDWRGKPYEDIARVNIISKTPQTIEQQLAGKITDVKLKSDTFYHGTSSENAKGILTSGFKKGSELPEDIFRGGGYGKIQNSISFAETPKEASIFSTLTKNGEIIEAKLKPNSKVVSIKGIEDANDLDEFIPYLIKQKVDAVYIGGGEKELVVINNKSITPVNPNISPIKTGGKK